MKRLLYCVSIVILLSTAGFAWQPFTYNDIKITPVKIDTAKNTVQAIDPVTLQYTFKDFQRAIREIQAKYDSIQAKYDSNFVQWGSGTLALRSTTDIDTLAVFLPVKYSNALYSITAIPKKATVTTAWQLSYAYYPTFVAVPLSDSSFVLVVDSRGSAVAFDLTWTTVGIRKR